MAHLDQFPMFRFATLLARQLSSPIANRLKTYARDHPRFGRLVCARVGRLYRAADLRFKMWSLQLKGPRAPLAVSDREAIDVGTDLLGEMIIFFLGAMIVIFEVNRQAMKQETKKLDMRSRWVAIRMSLEELKVELEVQQKEIDLLLEAIRTLDPDVPLPQPSTMAKPLPQVPAEPSTSFMKQLPQSTPGTDSAKPSSSSSSVSSPPSPVLKVPPNLSPSAPSQSTFTEHPATEPSVVPNSSLPDSPGSSPPVVHPPGCICVPPTPHLPPKPHCAPPPPKSYCPPPPPKPDCPPKRPPPTACD